MSFHHLFTVFVLKQLDNCNDYETRRKIRARIKALIGDKGKWNGPFFSYLACVRA